jgi:hypothetical protein
VLDLLEPMGPLGEGVDEGCAPFWVPCLDDLLGLLLGCKLCRLCSSSFKGTGPHQMSYVVILVRSLLSGVLHTALLFWPVGGLLCMQLSSPFWSKGFLVVDIGFTFPRSSKSFVTVLFQTCTFGAN